MIKVLSMEPIKLQHGNLKHINAIFLKLFSGLMSREKLK
jgi:hypothetical protein